MSMYSTADKHSTLRYARAEGTLKTKPDVIEKLVNNTIPKGNALEAARTAGLFAAKKTWELIPYCHPIPIDCVVLDFFPSEEGTVTVVSEVTAVWKTGVEMEAIVAVQIALATLYDMLKPLDAEMTIEAVRLTHKRGGKSSFVERIPDHFRAAVIVTSNGTHAGQRQDRSGQIIRERIESFLGKPCEYIVLPDDRTRIEQKLRELVEAKIDLIVTTGGTGLGPRDVTVEATRAVIDREVPGIMEAARSFGQARTPYAMLSRGLAGVAGKTLIINLPGSSNGTRESLDAIFPAILHSYPMMGGGGHDAK